MSDEDETLGPVMTRLVNAIDELEDQIRQKKRLVNELCREYQRPARYQDVDAPRAASLQSLSRDQFYGRPLASVVREYLEMRGPSNRGGLGAASVSEIYDAMVAGGFGFETKDAANAKRGLRTALAKNTQAFHRVGDNYGLIEWYPTAKRPKSVGRIAEEEADAIDAESFSAALNDGESKTDDKAKAKSSAA